MRLTVIGQLDRSALASQRNPTAISLFAGAGGCSLGFRQANYDIRFAMDIDSDAVESYQRNFAGTLCEVADIRETGADMLLQRAQLQPGELDILLGGPPCQGFSSAGVKAGEDPRNSLLRHYVRLLEGVRPKWFLMENVEGLLTNAGGTHIHDAVAAFLEAGYSVNVEKIYAQGYGVPQRRKRVIIVGNRLGHDFVFPEPVTRFSGNIFRKGEITFSTAVGDLPRAAESPSQTVAFRQPPQNKLQAYLRCKARLVTDHYSPPLSKIQLERVRGLRAGQTMKDLPEHLRHESFRRRAFRRVMDGTPVEKRGGAPCGLKWIFEVDNRAAQETGYLFEPVLASCLGGEAVGSKNSPVKRLNERNEPTSEGRQIDCYDGESQVAYEFKLRVTIAATGQGRFAEELSFPREARVAGLTPVLIVLDPTPSPRLDELIAAFNANHGKHYVGTEAWAHMDSKAGKTMAVFLERYIRPPLTEMAKHEDAKPETIQLSWTQSEICIQGTNAYIRIPRKS